MRALTERINTYLAVFIITVAGVGASLIILRVAYIDAASVAPQEVGPRNTLFHPNTLRP